MGIFTADSFTEVFNAFLILLSAEIGVIFGNLVNISSVSIYAVFEIIGSNKPSILIKEALNCNDT
jgi:hypothetical protein